MNDRTNSGEDFASTPNSDKWGEALNDGFLLLPAVLLKRQAELSLDNGEVVVLMNLMLSWWKVDELPFIQTSSIARRMGVSRRTVQRLVENLESKGFIKRIWGASRGPDSRAGASYDLRGIVERLKHEGLNAHPARLNAQAVKRNNQQGQRTL